MAELLGGVERTGDGAAWSGLTAKKLRKMKQIIRKSAPIIVFRYPILSEIMPLAKRPMIEPTWPPFDKADCQVAPT